MWGRAKTTPRPAARYSNATRICPVSCTPPISRPAGITGSRNASSQYRAYERMACLDSARSSPPGAWLPITRRRLPSSTCTPGPWRRQARPAANLNPRWAHDSGRRYTTDQPRPYPASVSLSLSLGTGHLLKRTPGRPVRLQDRLGNGNSRSQAIAEFPAPTLLRANPRQGQVPVAGGPRRSRVRDRRTPQEGCLTAARVVLLAVGQAPVGPAGGRLALRSPRRPFGRGPGLGHALERELRFRPGALHIDRDDLA